MEQDENGEQDLELPVLTMDQYKALLDAEAAETWPTQEMIEAGWRALDCDGLSCPPVETMQALWRAMWAARGRGSS